VAITVPNVVKVTGSGVTTVTTSGVATTTGGTFVAWSTADDGVTINAPTDSKSNSYGTAKVTVSTGGGTSKQTVYVKENGAGGAGHTLTFTYGSGTYPTVFFIECAGAATASYDGGSLTSGASGAGSPFNRNSGGQAQAANAILTFIATDAGGTLTYANSGYTVSSESDGNNYWTGATGYQIVNTTSAVTSSWTVAASNGGTITFAIKEASGGGPTTTTATAAAGVATVSGVGASTAATGGTGAGSATVSGAGSSTAVTTATAAAGSATVSAVGAAVNVTTATAAAGAATVSGVGSSTAATGGQANGVATVSGAGSSIAATTATTAAGTCVVSGVGSAISAGEMTAIPAAGVATVSAVGSSIAVTTAVPAAGTSTASATTPESTEQRTPGGSGGGRTHKTKKRTYNYDYSSPKAPEVVEPAPIKAVTKKAKKSVPADVAEMLGLIEASENATAQVLAEQALQRTVEEQARKEREDEIMAIIACCL
jgi:hypothetical protein